MASYENKNLQLGIFSSQRFETDRSWTKVIEQELQVKATLNSNDFKKMKAGNGCNVPIGWRHWNMSCHEFVDASGDISDEMGIVVMKITE